MYRLDFYALRPDILEAKYGNRQWEKLENLLLKKIDKLFKKKNCFICYPIAFSKKYSLSYSDT